MLSLEKLEFIWEVLRCAVVRSCDPRCLAGLEWVVGSSNLKPLVAGGVVGCSRTRPPGARGCGKGFQP